MMAKARDEPYIWVTWLTKLLAGEAHCEWALWFRAHNTYAKSPGDFDLAAWAALHGEMVRERADALRAQDYEVFLEEQNKFTLRGRAATVGGKPDIVAVKQHDALVIDCKTGAPRNSDSLQVLTYMRILPHVHRACKGKTLSGEVRYNDHAVSISPDKLTEDMTRLIRRVIERSAADEPSPKVPSFGECRFCDITSVDCPERIDSAPTDDTPDHDIF
jgi:hypothetical protein